MPSIKGFNQDALCHVFWSSFCPECTLPSCSDIDLISMGLWAVGLLSLSERSHRLSTWGRLEKWTGICYGQCHCLKCWTSFVSVMTASCVSMLHDAGLFSQKETASTNNVDWNLSRIPFGKESAWMFCAVKQDLCSGWGPWCSLYKPYEKRPGKCWISWQLQCADLPTMELKLPGNYDWMNWDFFVSVFVFFIFSKAESTCRGVVCIYRN